MFMNALDEAEEQTAAECQELWSREPRAEMELRDSYTHKTHQILLWSRAADWQESSQFTLLWAAAAAVIRLQIAIN